MTVKKTQYTKAELVKLAKEQEFGEGHLHFNGSMCALGWLLSLSGVHKSRMLGMSILHVTDTHGEYYATVGETLGISNDTVTKIYKDNDDANDDDRSIAVACAIMAYLPEEFILQECDEKFKGEHE